MTAIRSIDRRTFLALTGTAAVQRAAAAVPLSATTARPSIDRLAHTVRT